MMRLSNEAFAAEVLRRSAERLRAKRIRMKRISMAVGTAAACLVLAVGVSICGSMQKNALSLSDRTDHYNEKNEDYTPAEAEQAPPTPTQDKDEHKSGSAASAQTALTAEQTVWKLSDSPAITVLFTNHSTETVTLSEHDFVFVQGQQRCRISEETKAETVTVQPHETAKITLPAAKAVGGLRGVFRLVYSPDDSELTLTLE